MEVVRFLSHWCWGKLLDLMKICWSSLEILLQEEQDLETSLSGLELVTFAFLLTLVVLETCEL